MQGDPRWIPVRRLAVCAQCGQRIRQGQSAYYYPKTRTLYCDTEACGRRAALDFEAHGQDEDGY